VKIDIVTLFPEIALAPLDDSIIRRARDAGIADVRVHQLRDWSQDKHRRVDAAPFGGGPGMLLRPEPLFAAVEALRGPDSRVILLTPQGHRHDQATAARLACHSHLILLCGHYEGVDHRVVEALVDEEISIGDYILTNGALAAAVLCDSIIRLLPGSLGDDASAQSESFCDPYLLEAPAYTKPVEFRGMPVPEVLRSGNHAAIAAWRKQTATTRTHQNRPDLTT
jgi:tRNA (guanine37-N1)-methyltransferase